MTRVHELFEGEVRAPDVSITTLTKHILLPTDLLAEPPSFPIAAFDPLPQREVSRNGSADPPAFVRHRHPKQS